jgi:hypothetical protein
MIPVAVMDWPRPIRGSRVDGKKGNAGVQENAGVFRC